MKPTDKRILPFRAIVGLMILALIIGAIIPRNPVILFFRAHFTIF